MELRNRSPLTIHPASLNHAQRRLARNSLLLAAVAAVVLAARPSFADNIITVPSVPGSLDGANGASPSASGTNGGSASALASSPTDPVNRAIANGGTGGNGANGSNNPIGPGFPGGAGGGGGGANATAHNNLPTSLIVISSAQADGGWGGTGGSGGTGTTSRGLAGHGGSGGFASATGSGTTSNPTNAVGTQQNYALTLAIGATGGGGGGAGGGTNPVGGSGGGGDISNVSALSTGIGDVSISATASGGPGGGGPSIVTAGTGGSASIESINATSGAGNIDMNISAEGSYGGATGIGVGGNGGHALINGPLTATSVSGNIYIGLTSLGGYGGQAASSGKGGKGSDASIDSPYNVSTSGSITLFQWSLGGGGGGTNGGTAGLAGNATSIFNFSQNGMTTLQISNPAYAGSGGDCLNTLGAAGGNGVGSITVTTNSNIISFSDGSGGGGSNITGGASGTGGNGGNGSDYAFLQSTGMASRSAITASVRPGGGPGGSLSNGALGAGGNGGNADASATVSNAGPDPILVYIEAFGGSGGTGAGTGFSGGAGGIPTISANTAISTGGAPIRMIAEMYGGSGGRGDVSANGANGIPASLSNVFTYSTSGSLTLDQRGFGGNGGGSSGGIPGVPGSASSVLNFTQNDLPFVSASTSANGGNAGATQGISALAGANATASTTLTANTIVSVSAIVNNATQNDYGIIASGGDLSGGSTGNAGAGGTGYALASATSTGTTNGHSAAAALANASGGNGGNVTNNASGNGGSGGISFASAIASNAGPDPVTVTVTAIGGNGGTGQGATHSGGNGGIPQFNVSGTSTGGAPLFLTLTAQGGSGGNGTFNAVGGNAADVVLSNALSYTTSGSLTLTQNAIGGNGGGSDGAAPGAPGNAYGNMTGTFSGQSYLALNLSAVGGNGGDVQNVDGIPGGITSSNIDISSSSFTTINLNLNGPGLAHGSNIVAGANGHIAGRGGNAYSVFNLTGTGTGNIFATPVVMAGDGGSVMGNVLGSGGAGGDTSGSTTLSGQSVAVIQATYTGGNGGQGAGAGFHSGNGGAATGNIIALANGSATANITAHGGSPGAAINSAISGSIGVVSATASAFGLNNADASAVATGSSGLAMATARATGASIFAYIQTGASTAVSGAATVKAASYSQIGAPPFLVNDGAHAEALLEAEPQATEINTSFASASNVQSAFQNQTGNVTFVGLTNLDAVTTLTSSHLYSISLEINQINNQLTTGHQLLGMVGTNGLTLAPGDVLHFHLERNSVPLVDQTFTSSSAFLSYFQNTVLDLGVQKANLAGANLDLAMTFSLQTSLVGDGAGIRFLVGQGSGPGGIWNRQTGGSWAAPNNWSANTLPIGPGASATLGNIINHDRTVTLDENTTIGTMTFDSPSSYTISPGSGGSLLLDNAGSPAAITVNNGNHILSAPVVLTSAGLTTSVASGNSLTFTGTISGTGGLTHNGPGTLFLGASNSVASVLTSLAIAHTGSTYAGAVNLTDNKLIIQSTGPSDKSAKIADLNAAITAGANGATWTGIGITSSSAQGANSAHYGVGLFDNAILQKTSFGGQPTDTNSILIAVAHLGDTNRDGIVNIQDVSIVANNWQKSRNNWAQGDLNRDGLVNIQDFSIVANNWQQSSIFSLEPSSLSPQPLVLSTLSVPEPASLVLLASGLLLLISPQFRKRR